MPASLPTQTKVWILAEQPEKEVTDKTFSLETRDLPSELPASSVLVQTLYLSNDPAQRTWMQKGLDARRSYAPPVLEGDIMKTTSSVAKVLSSTSEKFKEGDLVTAPTGWAEYAVLEEGKVNTISKDLESPTNALSLLGGTGMTAYGGLFEVGHLKKEDTVVISGAAGSTGSLAVQIAKNIVGCPRVVGIAGGKEKCDWVKSLGADECVDYKSATFEEDLAKALPEDAQVYFDNVGGSVLNAMLPHIKRWGRVIACGSISTYHDASKSVMTNYFEVISNRITIQGFLVFDFANKFPEARKMLVQGIKDGKIKTGEHETIKEVSFEKIPEVWKTMFEGSNKGKLLTKIA